MPTKILAITHKNFSHLYYEVIELLNLPLSLEVLEVNFGELHKIDHEMFSQFDLVITSGAHLEMINKDYYELTYLVPFYPLHFTEADLVKGLAQAKKFGRKILLMYFPEEDYQLEQYEDLLDIELKRVSFSNLKEAEQIMNDSYQKGFNVVIGTSSVCEIADKKGIKNVLIYSIDSLKLEIIKAYQLAATKSKMVNYGKIKDVILQYAGNPIFLLDQHLRIIDTNAHGFKYVKKSSKYETIGEQFNTLINIDFKGIETESVSVTHKSEQIIIEPIMNSANSKMFIVAVEGSRTRVTSENKKEDTLNPKYQFTNIIHTSQIMNKVIIKTKQYAQTDAPLLIFGESGTGKELIAHSVHQYSNRKTQPFLPVNCSAIPQNILESELFGYEEGAFTGARKGGKPGYFEMAQNGTIFLDEIGEIPLDIQTKLLRVLQEKEVIRLGGRNIIPLDVRVITATNKPLVDLIRKKTFREDLYYRINVLQINVPPVRDRKEDIPLLLNHLLVKYGMDTHQASYLINMAKNSLSMYNWPGNVREMENFAQRFCALQSISNTTLDLMKLFTDIMSEFFEQKNQIVGSFVRSEEGDVQEHMQKPELEKLKIINVLLETNGNKNQTAVKLGMSRTTLWRKIKEYEIDTSF
ncbi:sigma 54-interacting transcriptional regulator [Neobacillus niacini]|uniref:sigma 54-interacting transcriptional regulator n=1 Tax=Neobacillus niacini TaxID=86668 RepID=UPI0007ABF120|nr:sigma 54-interacting transcriptional regulator [Neobacillus niacini]MEC1525429.1 sigma 54-interacting transcriptional regulator [Neobacillus niacini]